MLNNILSPDWSLESTVHVISVWGAQRVGPRESTSLWSVSFVSYTETLVKERVLTTVGPCGGVQESFFNLPHTFRRRPAKFSIKWSGADVELRFGIIISESSVEKSIQLKPLERQNVRRQCLRSSLVNQDWAISYVTFDKICFYTKSNMKRSVFLWIFRTSTHWTCTTHEHQPTSE